MIERDPLRLGGARAREKPAKLEKAVDLRFIVQIAKFTQNIGCDAMPDRPTVIVDRHDVASDKAVVIEHGLAACVTAGEPSGAFVGERKLMAVESDEVRGDTAAIVGRRWAARR